MSTVPAEYVEQLPQGGWRIAGSRVSLESIAIAYREGLSAEAIAEQFPTVSLEQVFGALAFYLGHRDQVDAHLAEQDKVWGAIRRATESQHSELLERIRANRRPTG